MENLGFHGGLEALKKIGQIVTMRFPRREETVIYLPRATVPIFSHNAPLILSVPSNPALDRKGSKERQVEPKNRTAALQIRSNRIDWRKRCSRHRSLQRLRSW